MFPCLLTSLWFLVCSAQRVLGQLLERLWRGGTEQGWCDCIFYCFLFFLPQLINQINLAVRFALLETEASVFLLIPMRHTSTDNWPAKGERDVTHFLSSLDLNAAYLWGWIRCTWFVYTVWTKTYFWQVGEGSSMCQRAYWLTTHTLFTTHWSPNAHVVVLRNLITLLPCFQKSLLTSRSIRRVDSEDSDTCYRLSSG